MVGGLIVARRWDSITMAGWVERKQCLVPLEAIPMDEFGCFSLSGDGKRMVYTVPGEPTRLRVVRLER